jgi:hypothetical protein
VYGRVFFTFLKKLEIVQFAIFRCIKSGTGQKIHSRTYRKTATHSRKYATGFLHDSKTGGFGFNSLLSK